MPVPEARRREMNTMESLNAPSKAHRLAFCIIILKRICVVGMPDISMCLNYLTLTWQESSKWQVGLFGTISILLIDSGVSADYLRFKPD